MKFLVTLLLCLLVCGVASAQSTQCPSSDSTLTPVDTLNVRVGFITTGDPGSGSEQKKTRTGQVTFDIVVWNTSSGQPILTIPTESINFTGHPQAINDVELPSLFNMMAQTGLARALATGQIDCSDTCDGSNVIEIFQPACVRRVGSGEQTTIVSCDPSSCCLRRYEICCPLGPEVPTIRPVGSQSGGCSSSIEGCIATCE